MIALWSFVVVALVLGVLSRRLHWYWTTILSIGLILGASVTNNWRYLANDGAGAARTLLLGLVWDAQPLLLFFLIPFLLGRLGARLLPARSRAA